MGVFFLVLGLIDIPVIDQLVAEQVSASCAASALQLRHRNTRQPACSLPACCCFASPVPLRPVSSCLIASPLVPTYHPHAVRPCRLRAAHCPLLRFLHLSLRRCPPPSSLCSSTPPSPQSCYSSTFLLGHFVCVPQMRGRPSCISEFPPLTCPPLRVHRYAPRLFSPITSRSFLTSGGPPTATSMSE